MNKIHNSLGRPGSLTITDVHWEKMQDGKNHIDVPVVSCSNRTDSSIILNQYFRLLFYYFKLPNKISRNKNALKIHANNLYCYLFPDDFTLDNDRLLELLIGNPQKNKETIHIEKKEGLEIAKKAFNYDYLVKQFREEFTALILLLDVKVCPYCNRSYTTTVINQGGRSIRTCQIDHFYPKSKYPWLALSLWNLIPVCGFCNHQKLEEEGILYPYEAEMGDLYRFRTHPTSGVGYLVGTKNSENDFIVSLDSMIDHSESSKLSEYEEQIEKEIKLFGINDLYSVHNDYICNIFRQRFIHGNAYADSLVSDIDFFDTRDDVRAMQYLKRIDSNSIGSNVLDKLTRDIDHEIDLLE